MTYFGKLILFGEYSMIFDSTALVIPLKRFSAHWEKGDAAGPVKTGSSINLTGSSNKLLRGFLEYLEQHEILSGEIETQRFRTDLDEGWELVSTIPFGGGFGSSGSVVAAVYDRYALNKTDDPIALKKRFAMMENYYHGVSSGLDPLQSYLGRPFVSGAEAIRCFPEELMQVGIKIGLIDTGIQRNTKPLVEFFGRQRQDAKYLEAFEREYIPIVGTCIKTFVKGDGGLFFEALGALSQAQLRFFRPMIPEHMARLFAGDYGFHFGAKILGAGGGGYMLVFTDDTGQAEAEELLGEFGVEWV